MKFQHLDQAARIAMGRAGGTASGQVMRQKRIAKWAALGVSPEVGQRIYDQGYMACNQKWVRKLAAVKE